MVGIAVAQPSMSRRLTGIKLRVLRGAEASKVTRLAANITHLYRDLSPVIGTGLGLKRDRRKKKTWYKRKCAACQWKNFRGT